VKLIDLLAADRILIDVAAETVRMAAQPLVHAIIESGRATDPDRLEALLAESLPNEAVTVGQQAFLLHFRTDAVERLTVALGVTAQPVHREHDASKEARIVLLLVAPAHEAVGAMRALATFAHALAREEVVSTMESATSPAEILAIADLVQADLAEELLVRDILRGRLVTAGPDTTLAAVADLMVKHRVPAVPIVSETNDVLGLVGYGEVLRYLVPHGKRRSGEMLAGQDLSVPAAAHRPVREVMDRSVLCLSDDQPVAEVADLMVNKRLERVPVVREGALVGVLSREDIVRRLFGP